MTLTEEIVSVVASKMDLKEITPEKYTAFNYPKFLPLMKFKAHQYEVKDFGNLMTLDTNAMFGLMKLSTIVFTPSKGSDVPFLLVDTMAMKKKHLAYVEYYDCTAKGAPMETSRNQAEEFENIPNYDEKPAWYIRRRTPYSLIKGGEGVSPKELEKMSLTCVKRYIDTAISAPKYEENIAGLKKFQREMLDLGNPSSETLNKVFGLDGAKTFFENVIMPV